AWLCMYPVSTNSCAQAVGGPGEDDQCEPLLEMSKRDSRIAYLVGKTSVGELMALIERSSLVVANDSAAVHMAVGFARPMVALYGPTDVVRVGPYARQRDVLQRVTPSDRLSHKRAENARLMERILVQDVFDAATARLAAGR
ncbi:MAG: glycosyltransferase family 9 protein, partial [Planctomycetota bacterium]